MMAVIGLLLVVLGTVIFIYAHNRDHGRRLVITRSTDVRDGPLFATWRATEFDRTWPTTALNQNEGPT